MTAFVLLVDDTRLEPAERATLHASASGGQSAAQAHVDRFRALLDHRPHELDWTLEDDGCFVAHDVAIGASFFVKLCEVGS